MKKSPLAAAWPCCLAIFEEKRKKSPLAAAWLCSPGNERKPKNERIFTGRPGSKTAIPECLDPAFYMLKVGSKHTEPFFRHGFNKLENEVHQLKCRKSKSLANAIATG